MTFFFVALQGSVGELRTNQEHFSLKNEKKIKNSQSQTKFTVSYKKKSVYVPTITAYGNSLKLTLMKKMF